MINQGIQTACNITNYPLASEFNEKCQLGKQNKTLTCPTWQEMFWAESSQCNSPLLNRVAGQLEVPTGQVNFRGSLPCSASNVLEPMLHPVKKLATFSNTNYN